MSTQKVLSKIAQLNRQQPVTDPEFLAVASKAYADMGGREGVSFRLSWNTRASKFAGRAWPTIDQIELGRIAFACMTRDEQLDTIIHEVAHMVAWQINRDASSHGLLFKCLCHKAGITGERCIALDLTAAVKQGLVKGRVLAYCPCGKPHTIPARAAKLQQQTGHAGYRCRFCRCNLSLSPPSPAKAALAKKIQELIAGQAPASAAHQVRLFDDVVKHTQPKLF
jgi:predicted SprT family Zn-dependent metalloprotease